MRASPSNGRQLCRPPSGAQVTPKPLADRTATREEGEQGRLRVGSQPDLHRVARKCHADDVVSLSHARALPRRGDRRVVPPLLFSIRRCRPQPAQDLGMAAQKSHYQDDKQHEHEGLAREEYTMVYAPPSLGSCCTSGVRQSQLWEQVLLSTATDELQLNPLIVAGF